MRCSKSRLGEERGIDVQGCPADFEMNNRSPTSYLAKTLLILDFQFQDAYLPSHVPFLYPSKPLSRCSRDLKRRRHHKYPTTSSFITSTQVTATIITTPTTPASTSPTTSTTLKQFPPLRSQYHLGCSSQSPPTPTPTNKT